MSTKVATMFAISIGGNERSFSCDSLDRGWVAQQLAHYHRQGLRVCISVHIPSLSRRFTTGCPTMGGGGSPGQLTAVERKLITEWQRVGDAHDPETGALIRFLNLICRTV